MRVAVFDFSSDGIFAQKIITAWKTGQLLPAVNYMCIIVDRKDALALEIAKQQKIDTYYVHRKASCCPQEFEDWLCDACMRKKTVDFLIIDGASVTIPVSLREEYGCKVSSCADLACIDYALLEYFTSQPCRWIMTPY